MANNSYILYKKITYLLLVICLFSLSCQQRQQSKLTIAAAANLQFAMKDLVYSFTETTGVQCEAILGSSGKLTAQIMEGAPFDLFVSADMKYPTALNQKGFSLSPPAVYAYGKLVLWSMVGHIRPSIEILTSDSIEHIALANPKTAPYGQAAIEVLKHYNIQGQTENKLVYGESIAQTNQFITSEAAECGFTAKSVVLSEVMKGKGQWIELDPAIYSPITQGVVILKDSKKVKEARQFFDFLFSEKGKNILEKFGYAVN
ncbi:MAG: molybdate ABC transporter substrate-binding protein [Bacteroidota bacterium]